MKLFRTTMIASLVAFGLAASAEVPSGRARTMRPKDLQNGDFER